MIATKANAALVSSAKGRNMYVHYTKMIFNQDFYVHSCLLFELILSIYSGVI